jgi:hypothetical protein
MSHSITVLSFQAAADPAILARLTERLRIPHTCHDDGSRALLWLQADADRADEAIVATLDETSPGWRDHVSIDRGRRRAEPYAGRPRRRLFPRERVGGG